LLSFPCITLSFCLFCFIVSQARLAALIAAIQEALLDSPFVDVNIPRI
jgi:hypothetical protein